MRRNAGKINPMPVKRCSTGKKQSTHAQAKKEAKYMKYNKKYSNMVPTPYFHKQCGWWHVGNTNE